METPLPGRARLTLILSSETTDRFWPNYVPAGAPSQELDSSVALPSKDERPADHPIGGALISRLGIE